ncbi:MAG: hypothetical protein BGO98_32745 [Myxococcales bacterium 68-20]|nr:MAG: hypothetical protein BGO98_32745 [Myxococcales bacterium 68-20]
MDRRRSEIRGVLARGCLASFRGVWSLKPETLANRVFWPARAEDNPSRPPSSAAPSTSTGGWGHLDGLACRVAGVLRLVLPRRRRRRRWRQRRSGRNMKVASESSSVRDRPVGGRSNPFGECKRKPVGPSMMATATAW